jgi:catechol 2,3-dioxygenase-like lactoylglutathione lyase family enzyme
VSAPELLGIDNVLFAVADLDAAVRFYEACGLKLKFRFDPPGMALFSIGGEAPGLLLRKGEGAVGKFWVEVRDAGEAAARLAAAGIATTQLETMTGSTVEAQDPSGNIIGFADYSKRPDLARPMGGYESP